MDEGEGSGYVRDRSHPLYRGATTRTSADQFSASSTEDAFKSHFVSGNEVKSDVVDNAIAFKEAEKHRWVPLAQQLEANRLKAEEEQREAMKFSNSAAPKKLDEDEVTFFEEAELRQRERERKVREEEEREVALFEAERAVRTYNSDHHHISSPTTHSEEDKRRENDWEKEKEKERQKAIEKANSISVKNHLRGRLVVAKRGEKRSNNESSKNESPSKKHKAENNGNDAARESGRKESGNSSQKTTTEAPKSLGDLFGGYASSDEDDE